MSPPADILRQLLIQLGLGSESVWPIFTGFFPGVPDEAMCCYDTAGKPDGRIMASGEQIIHPGVQVLLRGPDYLATREKAEAVAQALDGQRRTPVAIPGGETYLLHNVSRSGDILPLGMEEDGDRRRHLFAINSTMTVQLNNE